MRRADRRYGPGDWPKQAEAATVTLAFDDRHKRRFRLRDDAGGAFLLDLPTAVLLCDGDGLALEGGGYVRVIAAAEPVAELACATKTDAARLAWHIGNRHVPLQVLDDGGLRIRDDHVLVAMLEGLGATVVRRSAPFTPEGGAYAEAGHAHG
ncbi:MAG: urease accessory protein UreE [Alphaproteobacteria bacterium]